MTATRTGVIHANPLASRTSRRGRRVIESICDALRVAPGARPAFPSNVGENATIHKGDSATSAGHPSRLAAPRRLLECGAKLPLLSQGVTHSTTVGSMLN